MLQSNGTMRSAYCSASTKTRASEVCLQTEWAAYVCLSTSLPSTMPTETTVVCVVGTLPRPENHGPAGKRNLWSRCFTVKGAVHIALRTRTVVCFSLFPCSLLLGPGCWPLLACWYDSCKNKQEICPKRNAWWSWGEVCKQNT
jgi:hypothetical protein